MRTATVDADTRRLRSVHTRTAAAGLLACALAATVVLIAEGIGMIVFFAPFIAIPLVAAALVWRFGVWAKVVAIVLAAFLLTEVLPAIGDAITHPNSFFDFVPIVVFTLGALLAIGGSVAAIVKRADRRAEATTLERGIIWSLIGVIGLLVIGSGTATVIGKTSVAEADRAGALEVTISEFDYHFPSDEIAAGAETRLVVSNDDRVLHTFTVDGTDVDVTVTPGSEVLVELPPLDAGTYTVYCHPHSGQNDAGEWEGMVSPLTVH